MSDFREEIDTYIRQAEHRLKRIDGAMVEKTADHAHDMNLPGVEPVSTIDLPDGVVDMEPQYPGVRKVGVGRRVFHLVPPVGQEEEWHLTGSQDDVLFSAASDEGLVDALGDIVSLTKPGQESKDALSGRSRPLNVDEAVEYLMFKTLMEGTPEEFEVEQKDLGSAHPGARRLRRYWLRGEGALKIRWGTPNDFSRCVRHLRKYVGPGAEGLCNVMHTVAVGAPPGKGH